ncbi:non-ribosomal peptide synthetase [Paenibacillus sp. OK060]|uniref:non-ribosomal peptide synthetase n=1 Tax=Paenibacillus sp. OK060 TaxID=1881034 RepID=UPI001C40A78C|nr:non-ribosomal peptide synthetase [Paenibacillus sp. OK060]
MRGYRVELGEIEEVLLKQEGIRQAAVKSVDHGGDVGLCAYVVGEEAMNETHLREQLLQQLPHYMIPSHIVFLETLPMNSNGKIARDELQSPESEITSVIEEPQSEMEKKVASIWREVLGIEEVSRKANFIDLGGHSLKAIQTVLAIRKELGVEVSLQELFQKPVLEEMAAAMEEALRAEYVRIPRAKEAAWYPVSFAQRRMMILNEMEGIQTAYNMPTVLQLEGDVDMLKMEEVFRQLIERHEAFRTSLHYEEGEPVQVIHSDVPFGIEFLKDGTVEEVIGKFVRPFDLSKAPLIRVGTMQETNGKQLLFIDMHHIISDGVSMNLLAEEFDHLYSGYQLPELELQYKDYAVWQQDEAGREYYKAQEAYWLTQLSGDLPVLELPTDYPRPQLQSFEGAAISVQIDRELSVQINELAKKHGATQYMVMLAALNVLLSKYTGQEDIIVGTSVAGRTHADLSGIMGMFVNALPMRSKPVGNKTFQGFLEEVKEQSLAAFDNQDYPYEALVEKLNVRRDSSRNPVFDVMLNVRNFDSTNLNLEGSTIKPYQSENEISKFDLTLTVNQDQDKIDLFFEYATKLFKKDTIDRMIEHFITILRAAAKSGDILLSEIDILAEMEKENLINLGTKTKTAYPANKSISVLFTEQLERTPDSIAVQDREQRLTYRQLNERANHIAVKLQQLGVGSDDIVAILADRSIETIVMELGVIKAGGAYLPISPDSPEERINYFLMDSDTKVVLTKNCFAGTLRNGNAELLIIEELSTQKELALPIDNSKPNDLAYVMYTSGTTGKPKGVMVEHRNVVRLVKNTNYIRFEEGKRMVQTGDLTFDASTFEIWGALLNGMELHIIDKNTLLNSKQLEEVLNNRNIDTMWLTSPLFNELSTDNPNMFRSLKQLVIGGDVLSPSKVREVVKECKTLNIINGYGPTENTTFSCSYLIEESINDNSIPIGRPINNSTVFVVNNHGQLCPTGVPGELWVGGDGVARGYLNEESLTKEKFIASPFNSNEKLYRTGDLVKWLKDGNLEYLGRIDDQVKIRGHRIEIGEIETVLMKHDAIKQAYINTKTVQDELVLCAYIVTRYPLRTELIKKHLLNYLPSYMVPTFFIQMDRLPLTENGKVDRDALPQPEVKEIPAHKVSFSDTERKLAQIWSEILGIDGNIGAEASFFELGGHSLKAIGLLSAIRKEFGVEINLQELFQKPALDELAATIDGSTKTLYARIPRVEKKDWYPVSFAQRRMMILNEMEGIHTTYNMPTVLQLEGNVDMSRLEEVFRQLIKRHEVFRTSLHYQDGEPVQVIHPEISFAMENLTGENIEVALKEFVRPFDLTVAPLLRVGVLRAADEKKLLFIDMHHIISDGVSSSILAEEFDRLYNGQKLPELDVQYKDYAVWQQEGAGHDLYKAQETYWLELLSGNLPVLELPTDYPRPQLQTFEGNVVSMHVDQELSTRINEIATRHGATNYMVMLAALNVLLSKYTDQEDILVGTPVAGRTHADIQDTFGLFVNTVVMRNQLKKGQLFKDFLLEVKQNAINAFENQDYPFESLIDKLNVKRDFSRNPVVDLMLTIRNINSEKMEANSINATSHPITLTKTKFDLTITVLEEHNGTMQLQFEYATKLFREETVTRMAQHFTNILSIVTDNEEIEL